MAASNKGRLLAGKRKLVKVGGSAMIALPKDWLEQHGYKIGEEIPFVANRDLALLSRESAAESYQTGTELVRKSRKDAEGKSVLLQPERDVPPGSKIR